MIFLVNALEFYFLDPQNIIDDRKLYLGLDQYNRYMKVISETIKYHDYGLAFYEKVEKLGYH